MEAVDEVSAAKKCRCLQKVYSQTLEENHAFDSGFFIQSTVLSSKREVSLVIALPLPENTPMRE